MGALTFLAWSSRMWLLLLLSFPAFGSATIVAYRATMVELPNATVSGVSGTVIAFHDDGDTAAIGYGGFLKGLTVGLDANGKTCTNATNGCGVHVHNGTSCASSDMQGGHYYDATVVKLDPWIDVRYSSDANGAAVFSGVVIPGGAIDIAGRAFVGECVAVELLL